MARGLKLYNGRPHGKYLKKQDYKDAHFNIAAFGKSQARLIIDEFAGTRLSQREIREYYAECWGNNMAGIVPDKPGLWVTYRVVEEGKYVTKIEHHEWTK